MANDMEHERVRWGKMNPRQLEARLQKITDGQKLANFLYMARVTGNRHLEDRALRRIWKIQADKLADDDSDYKQETRSRWEGLTSKKMRIEEPPERIFWKDPMRVIRFDANK